MRYFVKLVCTMKNIEVKRYRKDNFNLWNNLVAHSKNATFLFHRDFMDYHKEQFEDHSIMVFEENVLKAIFPAHAVNENVYSHNGLTYGGLIVSDQIRTTDYILYFKKILQYYHQQSLDSLFWKEIPSFYCSTFSDEWKYLSFVCNAFLYRRDLCSVVDLKGDFRISKSIKRDAALGKRNCDGVVKSTDYHRFWNEVLTPEMEEKYHTKPVHNLSQILSLSEKFPDNIHLYTVYKEEELIAGTVLFISKDTVHCQYISGKKSYRSKGILDYLFYYLIHQVFSEYKFFDFGISNESNGRKLNKGLLFWKEGFGARSITQDFYKIETENYQLIDQLYL